MSISFNRKLALFLVIALLTTSFIVFVQLRSEPLEVTFIQMKFESLADNFSNKNIYYEVVVKNTTRKKCSYRLVFTRNPSEVYPYLDSIPERYVSKTYSIDRNSTEYIEVRDIYVSEQNSNTQGFYNNFKVEVEYDISQ